MTAKAKKVITLSSVRPQRPTPSAASAAGAMVQRMASTIAATTSSRAERPRLTAPTLLAAERPGRARFTLPLSPNDYSGGGKTQKTHPGPPAGPPPLAVVPAPTALFGPAAPAPAPPL